MVDRSEIQDGMEVVGRDGVPIGRVHDVESGRILLTGGDARDGTGARAVPLSHVHRVEGGRVHLLDSAAVETGGLKARIAEATGDPMPDAPHGSRRAPLLWIIGGVVFAAVLLGVYLLSIRQEEKDLAAPPKIERGDVSPVGTGGAQPVALPSGRTVTLDPLGQAMQVNNFLADTQLQPPRAFRFERLAFDTGSAAIRPAERADVDALGQVLAAYPNARVRVVGFADARGSAPVNAELGLQRAQAVVAALAAQGAGRDRMEAVSGGESAPAATNATANGRQENRRTELVVLAK